ncbi:MAG: hypothetical protein COT89_00210 [Candidatus Colwellbacteria bacterium CG10_big_fil_rev_8_21_14_0_10_42_22]|uniref:Uncharacterized protein n=1 Tax=Candidatus Colwellbacteria bacterium CG10_big_fil_rev_8_21_14_0_10_42_22 TaxID=1974540 RepID=A0A2H0VGV2_9BACT|nr:MAG: hypothetical protein COT89_00210 [Candidatus Colwellbacteria bacterium CG10_big_fil_rev_8_21_14_0_10_42_22]
MKLSSAIIIISLVFVGAFFVYSHSPVDQTPETIEEGPSMQANISESVEKELTLPESKEKKPEFSSTSGLEEELKGFVEGFDEINEQLEQYDSTSTKTQEQRF